MGTEYDAMAKKTVIKQLMKYLPISVELLEKVNAKDILIEAEIAEWQRVRGRVDMICNLAYETGTPIFIDAEDSWIQDAIDGLVNEMMEKYNKKDFIVYNTIQLYRQLSFLSSPSRLHW